MDTVPEIIAAFGGATAFARCIGKKPSTASEMKRSGSIPVRYWPRLVAEAKRLGIKLTYEILVEAHVPATQGVVTADDFLPAATPAEAAE